MTAFDHYLDIIWDYHHGQHTRSLTLESTNKAEKLYEMLEDNKHITNLTKNRKTITFDYEKQTETTARQLRANPQ